MSKSLDTDTFSEALNGLRDEAFIASPKYGEQQWRARTHFELGGMKADGSYIQPLLAHPDVLLFKDKMVKAGRKLGIPLFASEVIRTKERQTMLYVQGVSKTPDASSHLYGLAVDIIHGLKGWDLTPKQWLLLHHIGNDICLRYGLYMTWGGSWRPDPVTGVGWDPAHWELAYWKDIKQLAPFSAGFDRKTGRPKRRPSGG